MTYNLGIPENVDNPRDDSTEFSYYRHQPLPSTQVRNTSLHWEDTSHTQAPGKQPKKCAPVDARRATFKTWPADSPVSSADAARAGFCYTSNEHAVQCPDCGLWVIKWPLGDTPLVVHARRSPQCPFVRSVIQEAHKPLPAPRPRTRKRPTMAFEDLDSVKAIVDLGFYSLDQIRYAAQNLGTKPMTTNNLMEELTQAEQQHKEFVNHKECENGDPPRENQEDGDPTRENQEDGDPTRENQEGGESMGCTLAGSSKLRIRPGKSAEDARKARADYAELLECILCADCEWVGNAYFCPCRHIGFFCRCNGDRIKCSYCGERVVTKRRLYFA